jgi:hypothetical protein
MTPVDPTTVATEGSVSVQGDLSIEVVAEMQEFLRTGSSTLARNGNGGNGLSAVAERIAASKEVAEQPAIPPLPQPLPVPFPPPFPPLPLLKRKVSGRYHSTGPVWQVELRIDVDGKRPMGKVSADYYAVVGATLHYFGSMRVDTSSITVTNSQIIINGLGSYTWNAGAPVVCVTIPRTLIFQPPAPASLRHFTISNMPGATYVCTYMAPSFRTVMLEEDHQDTVPTPFVSYDTGSLPSGGPARLLTVPAAYAEAGIEMQSTGRPDVVNTSEAGTNGSWSNAELHAAMEQHFSLWQDIPQWAVWLFHAQLHDIGPGLLGIMFDQQGRQRQGASVFYQSLAGTTIDKLRLQLYTCVHELGHCFNLLHSWQKSLAISPGVDRPDALSWMNYPWSPQFPGGQAAFWNGFAFQFDDLEVVHLRHAFRDDIIMGGNDFRVGSALVVPGGWRDPIQDNSGLKLEIQAPASFPFGAPVSVELHLSATDTRGKLANSSLKPSTSAVEVAIRNPNGAYKVFRPLIQHCMAETTVSLNKDQPEISDGAFIGYGLDGFYFDQPGFYQIRARYSAPDGSIVLSNIQRIQIQRPLTASDEDVATLFFDEQVGILSSLVGSDHEGLKRGNDALTQIRKKYASHPLAAYARLIQGVNLAREFKTIGADNRVIVRNPDAKEASALLDPIVKVSTMPVTTTKMLAGTPEHVEATTLSLLDQANRNKLAPDLRTFMHARKREIATEITGIVSADLE